MLSKLKGKFLVSLMLITFLSGSLVTPAMADLVPTSELVKTSQQDGKRQELAALLSRDNVAATLVQMGVEVDDALERVNNMTDAEVLSAYQQIDNLPAGEGLIGTVIGLLVIFILLDIAGVTDIFPAI